MKRRDSGGRVLDPRPAGATNAKELAAFEKYIGHRLPVDYSLDNVAVIGFRDDIHDGLNRFAEKM